MPKVQWDAVLMLAMLVAFLPCLILVSDWRAAGGLAIGMFVLWAFHDDSEK